jgi:uncharacterized protein (TIGR03437 family)
MCSDPDLGEEIKVPVEGLTQDWRSYTFPLSRFPSRYAGESWQDRLKKLYVVMALVFDGRDARTVYLRRVSYGPVKAVLDAVVNAASNAEKQPVAAGEIATLWGKELGPVGGGGCGNAPDGRISTACAGTRVLFDGIPAPLFYVQSRQINAQVPYEVAGKPATKVQVEAGGQKSNELSLAVAPSAPGLFTGTAYRAAALNQNGSYNTPENPEARGNVVVLFGTGEGQTVPGGFTGQLCSATALSKPVLPCSVQIGGQPADVIYCGCAPGFAGLLQVNAKISAAANAGQVPVFLTIGSSTSQAGITISVR